MGDEERLHATDRQGNYLKTAPRGELLREMRTYARAHGESPFAVPVVHVLLLTSDGQIRLVQRGDKSENPFLWDKACGGHVVCPESGLPKARFIENACKELDEEIGVEVCRVADDAWHYLELLKDSRIDLTETALVRMIDVNPWQGSFCRAREGTPWLKRHNLVVFAGLYDGPLQFNDGEAINSRDVDPKWLLGDLQENPWNYADGVRGFMTRYYHLMLSGLQR
uniref:Nudix hydrolase domain-containing protein n=1 Tax=Magnetococcus massalia (strain MO-1) TaxID=451514 RepID=A0A1S7LI08_MAGMO|nr:Conserved protein of unknown function[Include NUDIX hydrolase domain] [Candidatus Magnetococcus massalia]